MNCFYFIYTFIASIASICHTLYVSDTVAVTLMFDNTSVPVNETTYVCQSFDIPDDREYHLFASRPEIENRNVMHHSVVYGCGLDLSDEDSK